MLAKDPAERYATPRELLHELRAISIELYQDDPGDELDGWQDDLLSMVEARRQATQKLAVAMRTSSMPTVGRKGIAGWIAACLFCLLLGGGAAWALRPSPVIVATAEDLSAIPKHATADEQLLYATLLDTEAGWQSVPYYFPERTSETQRAKQGLALLYLRDYDYAQAKEIFDEFAAYNDAEVQLRAFGLAGQAVVLIRENKFTEAADKLTKLWPQRGELDGEMRVLIGIVLSERRIPGDFRSFREWRQWLERAPRSPATEGAPAAS
jgi:hypothetical protein